LAHPNELVVGIDASHAAMRQASRRAARSQRRGGLPNALFVASALEALPPEVCGLASLVTVHFPWGSLLRASLGEDRAGAASLARLVASGGRLRLLISADERDAGRGATSVEPNVIVAVYGRLGLCLDTWRAATLHDVTEARSSWGRRLMTSGGNRSAWLVELRRP
jgi:16S rRNA (adenine(1408)-N(1))-methyltransferase